MKNRIFMGNSYISLKSPSINEINLKEEFEDAEDETEED